MSNQAVGILPYGSNDTSIVLQCDCTSLAGIQAVGGAERNAGKCDYDATLGMRANATNGGIAFTQPTGYAALDFAGQVSFEVETPAVVITNSGILSAGDDQTGNVYLLVLGDAASPTNYLRCYVDSNERTNVTWGTGGVSGGTSPGSSPVELTSAGKGAFTRYTLSWIGNKYDWFVDGRWMFQGNRNGVPAGNIGTKINLMSGGGLGNALVGRYARNLLVSTKPVAMPTHPQLKGLAIVGHSFAARSTMWNYSQTFRDHSIGLQLRAALWAAGVGPVMPNDSSLNFASSGATILRSGGNPLQTQVNLAVAAKPECVVYMGGTNDAINGSWATNRAQVLADAKSDCTDLLAVARSLVFVNVPTTLGNSSNFVSSNRDANVLQINSDIATLPAWWDAANPTRKGMLRVVDAYALFGASAPSSADFWGLATGALDDLHPSPTGNLKLGNAIAQAVLATLG